MIGIVQFKQSVNKSFMYLINVILSFISNVEKSTIQLRKLTLKKETIELN